MPPTPKRHHFVPQLLIRNFAAGNGHVQFYSKDAAASGIVARNPQKVFVRQHLYTRFEQDGIKDVSQEHAFGELENAAAPVIRKIINAARQVRVPGLRLDKKLTWDAFLYEQWRRVPDLRTELFTRETVEVMRARIIAKLEK